MKAIIVEAYNITEWFILKNVNKEAFHSLIPLPQVDNTFHIAGTIIYI